MIEPPEPLENQLFPMLIGALLTWFIVGAFVSSCRADTISEDVAVSCILGEARSEYSHAGYPAFLAVAEVLRRRGSTQGVYGCGADFSAEEPYLRLKGLDKEAVRAWRESLSSNITGKATHWENVSAFGEPYWAKGMTKTVKIGLHQFYRGSK